jgi:Rieske Fe-S protein
LTAAGEDHKTGHSDNTEVCFRKLESYVRTHFDVAEVAFRWSSQYFEPADGLPYIGNLPGHEANVYVATGFGGNGMMYSAIAAMKLTDILSGNGDAYQKLFDPNRLKPVAGFTNFVKEGADVIKNFVTGKFSAKKLDEIAGIAADEAAIVKYENHTIGLYKDINHQLHAIDPGCTHINCTVKWNDAEKSWDCPCHGSRFSIDGEVLTGPAQKNLHQVYLDAD